METTSNLLDRDRDPLTSALDTQRAGWALFIGVLVSLSSQIVLSLLGIGVGLSTGDRLLGSGFLAYWVVLQLCAITAGAITVGYLSSSPRITTGAFLGALSWAVLVIFDVAFHRTTVVRDTAGGAWASFFSSVFGLALALVGGVIGVQLRHAPGTFRIALGRRSPVDVAGPPVVPQH